MPVEGRVAVIGLGAIGGSVAAALRNQGRQVCGYDRSAENMRVARERGLIDESARSPEDAVWSTDAVILAVPVRTIGSMLAAIDLAAPREALVLDTGSVKGSVLEKMVVLAGAERTIGGHPLAGTERSGPEAARPDLFRGRAFLLCRHRRTADATVERATALARDLGADPVVVIKEPESHDRVLARTSHLPQLLSTALALSLEPVDADFAGPGLRDMTRLAGSDPIMWRDILRTNRDSIVGALWAFRRELEELSRLVETDDEEGIEEAMRRGAESARAVRREVAP
jgi:prephenate dehydrogenase